MIETLGALLFAHMIADYPFQTRAIAENKSRRGVAALAAHTLIVCLTAHAALGTYWSPWLLGLTAAHLCIDIAKSFLPDGKLWPFLVDQGAHVLTIFVVALLMPDLWAQGAWAGAEWAASIMVLLAGFIAATQAGGYAVGFLLGPFDEPDKTDGLADAGRIIGLLERGLIYVLVMVGQPAGIGFLIAAKSILRFETASNAKNQKAASEYIIIGTLASFGWAVLISWASLMLLDALTPIGIPALTP